MPFPLLLIAGSITASKAVTTYRNKRRVANRLILEQENDSESIVVKHQQEMIEKKQDVESNLKLSGISVAITGVAQLAFPPLLLIGVPLTVYTAMPILDDAVRGAIKERQLRATVIDSLAIGGTLLTGYYFTTAVLNTAFFISQKVLIQTEDKSTQGMMELFNFHTTTIWQLIDGVEVEVPFEEIKEGDTVVINAGETIPYDGALIDGLATVDQHMLTGEAQPQEKKQGDQVFASTLLVSGRIFIRVDHAGKDTLSAQIGDILQNTSDFKSNIEARGIEIGNRLTLPTLGVSSIALATLGPLAAVAVISCNFADIIRISLPLVVVNHLNRATKEGILIKDGRALELLADIDTVVFDKTGTLTKEEPSVGRIYTFNGFEEDQLLALAAAAEYRQTHPVALAILKAAKARQLMSDDIDQAHYEMGYGIKVTLNQQEILLGSQRFMQMEKIKLTNDVQKQIELSHQAGHSLVYLAVNNQFAGMIELQVTLRPEVPEIIRKLRKRGLSLCIISGDHEEPTRNLAHSLGITDYFAETLPEDKARHIETLQAKGHKVCFIGDGINDAIAMKKAQVAISIAGSTTIATDTAGIVFADKSLSKLDQLFELSATFEKNLKASLNWSLAPGLVGVGGVFFLHMRIYAASALYIFSLVSSLISATLPALKDGNLLEKQTTKKQLEIKSDD